MTDAPRLSAAERTALLSVAMGALREHLAGRSPPAERAPGALAVPRGAFVTLRIRGELRGCVGTFTPAGSLSSTVARMAVAAAVDDPRFPPVSPDDLDELDVHVSVLDPLRRMRDLSELQVGRDGILVQLGWHRGALLPSVAVEERWDAVRFLERTCIKAGLPPSAWRDPKALVELFSTEEVGGDL